MFCSGGLCRCLCKRQVALTDALATAAALSDRAMLAALDDVLSTVTGDFKPKGELRVCAVPGVLSVSVPFWLWLR